MPVSAHHFSLANCFFRRLILALCLISLSGCASLREKLPFFSTQDSEPVLTQEEITADTPAETEAPIDTQAEAPADTQTETQAPADAQAETVAPAATIEDNLTPAQRHKAHIEKLKAITSFYMKGRMGIQADGKGYTATTIWQHDNSTGNQIRIISPIGSEVAKIESDNAGVTLTNQEGKVFSAIDAETLTKDTLGWELPMRGMEDWALGRPTEKLAELMEWDKDGRIIRLVQNGWDIRYPEYIYVDGLHLPRKIQLNHPKLNLKMVIEEWKDAK